MTLTNVLREYDDAIRAAMDECDRGLAIIAHSAKTARQEVQAKYETKIRAARAAYFAGLQSVDEATQKA